MSATYLVPFTGHALTRGWQLATVVQSQSGNPVNIVTSNSSLNGVPNSVRPDVTGRYGSSVRWISGSIRLRSWPAITSATWDGMS